MLDEMINSITVIDKGLQGQSSWTSMAAAGAAAAA
jgi:hypothetical protein